MKRTMKFFSAFAVVAVIAAVTAFASVTFNPDDGTGFVGKGDVQLLFGWNNKQLQDNAAGLEFEYEATSTTVTEVSWICTNSNNETTQERERTTTVSTSTQGIVDSIARERNQITGFILNGYSGPPTINPGTPVTEGPPLNSCPSGPWSLTTPAGDPEVISSETTGGLFVNGQLLPITP